jgi:competence protein ComFC
MTSVSTIIRRATKRAGRALVDTVYPKTCAGCGLRGEWLCDMCDEETLRLDHPVECLRCGHPMLAGRCRCADVSAAIQRARAYAVYDRWTATAVKRLKYLGEPDRARHLASLMAPMLAGFGPVDGLVPVPLHPSKQRARGFNQSRLLAERMSELSGVPMLDVLVRTKKTVSQTSLSGHERKENVAGVFAPDPLWHPYPDQRYVLIDDVRTTGSTLNECAEVLQRTSPAMIGILTFAMDMQPGELKAYRDYVSGLRKSGMRVP